MAPNNMNINALFRWNSCHKWSVPVRYGVQTWQNCRIGWAYLSKWKMILIISIYLSLPPQITRDGRTCLLPSYFKATRAANQTPPDYTLGWDGIWGCNLWNDKSHNWRSYYQVHCRITWPLCSVTIYIRKTSFLDSTSKAKLFCLVAPSELDWTDLILHWVTLHTEYLLEAAYYSWGVCP